jgi:Family of unknown function (DUF5677)
MPKGRKQKGRKRKRQHRATSLAEHKREKRTLSPPLMTLGGGMAPVSYHREFLPDLLWIAAMFDDGRAWSGIYEALDLAEGLSPPRQRNDGDQKRWEVVDGRLSAFAFVPEDARADVRSAWRESVPWALPDDLGHALLLYPECPAAWLYEDWSAESSVDPERGLAFLKGVLVRYGDRETVEATHLRMVPIARLMKAGVVHLMRGVGEDWPKYPGGLDEDGQARVQASMRAMYNLQGSKEFAPPAAYPWAEHFWRQNWNISACEFGIGMPPPSIEETEESDPPETDPRVTVQDVHAAWTTALWTLERGLVERQLRAPLDLWNPVPDEVRLGLASRVLRLVHELIDDPNQWTSTGAAHLLRAIVDTRIVVAWLLKKDDEALYEQFKEYGMGKTKLYKLHLEDFIDEHEATDLDELREQLEREVNAEVLEEFQRISLAATFSGRSIREMAEEAELKPVYTLTYQPLSSEAHGDWGSLRRHDLRFCTNPLHGFHRIGRFELSEVPGSLALVHMAFDLARDAVVDVFAHYGIATDDLFDACVDAFNAALP